MARYINEDEFIAWVREHWCLDCQNDSGLRCRACWIDDAIDIVEEAPEADVAPKSEVESILDGLMKEIREIAERYEKSANETTDHDYARIEYRGCQMGALLAVFKIAELKKKYTGEQT